MRALVLADEHSRDYRHSLRGTVVDVLEIAGDVARVTFESRDLWVRLVCLWLCPVLVTRQPL